MGKKRIYSFLNIVNYLIGKSFVVLDNTITTTTQHKIVWIPDII